MCSNLIYES